MPRTPARPERSTAPSARTPAKTASLGSRTRGGDDDSDRAPFTETNSVPSPLNAVSLAPTTSTKRCLTPGLAGFVFGFEPKAPGVRYPWHADTPGYKTM
jgi:hypothetical protein